MAYICKRCGEAHGDGQPCPYPHSLDEPDKLENDKLRARIERLEKGQEEVNDFIRAFRLLQMSTVCRNRREEWAGFNVQDKKYTL